MGDEKHKCRGCIQETRLHDDAFSELKSAVLGDVSHRAYTWWSPGSLYRPNLPQYHSYQSMRCRNSMKNAPKPPTCRVNIDDDRASKNGCDKEEWNAVEPDWPVLSWNCDNE